MGDEGDERGAGGQLFSQSDSRRGLLAAIGDGEGVSEVFTLADGFPSVGFGRQFQRGQCGNGHFGHQGFVTNVNRRRGKGVAIFAGRDGVGGFVHETVDFPVAEGIGGGGFAVDFQGDSGNGIALVVTEGAVGGAVADRCRFVHRIHFRKGCTYRSGQVQ